MSDDFHDQVALQRHMYKNLLYTAYWRGSSIQTKDIDGLCKDIGFPAHLTIPAYQTEFEYVPFAERTIQFGVLEKHLPPYVFKKNLEQYYPIQKGFLSSFFDSPAQNFKYGPNDSNLLLGSRRPSALIKLVESFGFQLQSSAAEIINAISVDKYFAVVDDLNTYSLDIEDIIEMIFISGIDLVEDFTVKPPKSNRFPPINAG